MNTRSLAVAVLAVVAVSVTGCSGDDEPSGSAEEQVSSAAPSAGDQDDSQEGGQDSGTTDAEPADEQPAAELGEPVASRTSSDAGTDLKLDVHPVSRSGELAVLNFAVTVPASAQGAYTLSDRFTDNNADAGDASTWTVDGVQLTDPANGKLYLVASDGEGNCVCTHTLGEEIQPGTTRTLTATYAAPPEDVQSVNVSFPIFGTVTGVPVG